MEDSRPLIKQFLQRQSEFMAYVMAITRDFHAAEEVFQNAAIVVMEKSQTDAQIRDFRAWVKEVVRRQALKYLREECAQRQRIRPLEPSLVEQISRAFVEDPTEEPVMQQEISALEDCIKQVPEAGRTMLSLRYEERASFRAIGETLKKTEAAVQRALCRLRKSLHDCVRSKVSLSQGGSL